MTATTTVRRPEQPAGQDRPSRPPGGAVRRAVRRLSHVDRALGWPLAVAALNGLLFIAVSPDVGDIYAALARESAVAHGVGLTYWFAWFGGGSAPASYSVLSPWLSALVGAEQLGTIATIAITPLCWRALRRNAPHPLVGTWLATALAALNLWSGRVPFALGCAFALAALAALPGRRVSVAAGCAILAALASPVSGAFLGLGLAGLFLTVPPLRRRCVALAAALLVGLLGVAVAFGTPGPEHFTLGQALSCALPLAAFLLVRPPPALRAVIWLSLLACPLLLVVPNGLGTNFQRLAWYVLPAAVAGYSGRPLTRRLAGLPQALSVAGLALVPALACAASQTVGDVRLSTLRDSSPTYFAALSAHLDTMRPALRDCRLEVVDDGSHTGAYALLNDVMLARGWESQDDRALNEPVISPKLDAITYKVWLQDNAVCYVALSSTSRTDAPEYRLVADRRPGYLTPVWHNRDWTLLSVRNPNPIVAPPVRVTRFSQSTLVLSVPCSCRFTLRVRYSRYLSAVTSTGRGRAKLRARIQDDGFGWSTMTTRRPGRYVLSGDLLHGLLR